MVIELEELFPGLVRGGCYQVTSSRAPRYNCIAWAAGETGAWWWPGPNLDEEFWPPGLVRMETLVMKRTTPSPNTNPAVARSTGDLSA